MSDLPDAIGRLAERIEALERRVSTLEHPPAAQAPKPKADAVPPPPAPAIVSVDRSGNLFPVLGRSLLGIAGAYVLRAVEEASSLPRLAVASAGIVYAFLWLVWAARIRGGPRFSSTIYASTSALILAPMVWELTLHFQVLPPFTAAGIVCAYALAAVGLAWRRNLWPLVRVAWIASAALALALAIASHAMVPFIVVLLIMAVAIEFTPALNSLVELRAVVALAADVAIWILIFLYFNPQNAIQVYPPFSRITLLLPGLATFLLYAASVTFQTVLRAQRIAIFAAIQTTIAFLLAAVCLADFGPSNSTILLGVACLILSAVNYAAVFIVFQRLSDRRNSAIFSAWAAALLFVGSLLCLPPFWSVAILGCSAVAAAAVSRWLDSLAFQFYATFFLLSATAVSGLLRFLVNALVANPSGIPEIAVWLTVLCAALCYATTKSLDGQSWARQVLQLVQAALLAGSLVALLAQMLFALIALKVVPGAHHLAFVRTLTLCAASLALVFSGARWHRMELTRLSYALLALVALKLLFEDLRHGHLAYIAASIFMVALTLIAAPRMARASLKG